MAGSKTASTLFSGKGTDPALATDVYAIKDSSNKNSLFDSLKQFASDSADSLKPTGNDVRRLLEVGRDVAGGYTDKAGALDRLGFGLNLGTVAAHSDKILGVAGKVAENLGLSPELTGQIKTSINGTVQYLYSSNVMESRDIMGMAGDLLGNSDLAQFFDLEAEANMLNGYFNTAIEYGMYDILDMVKDQDRYDYRSFSIAVMSSSSQAIFSGDINSLLAVLNHISVEQLLGENPDAIKDFLSFYRFNKPVDPSMYQARLTELVTLLVRLDARWYETVLNGQYVINYDVMSMISDDARTLFSIDPILRPIVITAPFYPSTSPLSLAATMYPNSAINA